MELLYWLWLQAGLGYGAQNSGDLLRAYDNDAYEIYKDVPSLPFTGLVTNTQVKRLASIQPDDYVAELKQSEQKGITVISFADRCYPELLRNISNPPPILRVSGNVEALTKTPCVGMVGARLPSPYGMEAMRLIAGEVAAAGAVVVSGLAAGLDAEAHKAALAVGGTTIACIAFGHGYCYPAANRRLMKEIEKTGAVISEYPYDMHPEKVFFLQRNRLIAGVSQGVMVAEARPHSGTMSTVNFAHDYGRDVFAIPGSILSELSAGTNEMLREGAGMVLRGEDLLEGLGSSIPFAGIKAQPADKKEVVQQITFDSSAAVAQMDEATQKVYAKLSTKPVALGVLCEECGLAVGVVMAALTELELAGVSRQLPGRQFVVAQ